MTRSDILLIGGSGFLGVALATGLMRNGWRVGISDQVPPPNLEGNAETFVADLIDVELLRKALKQYLRVVYLAQKATSAPAADCRISSFMDNLEMFLTVLEEATRANVQEFTLLSSGGAVYGETSQAAASEDDPKHPVSPYGVLKLTMEQYLAMTAASQGFRHLCLRPSNPYGPGQNINGAQGLVAVSMARIARGQTVAMLGEGTAVKDYVFIDDFVGAVIRLLNEGRTSGTFNIGSGQGRSVREVVDLVAKTVGKNPIIEHKPIQKGDVQRNVLSIDAIKSLTGWAPTTSFEEGLAKTWEWMKTKV